MSHKDFTGRGKVAIVRTSPQTVLEDYARLMELANYRSVLPPQYPTLLKINISWQTWYPACSTAPWQLEGVIRKLQADGYTRLLGVHNDTVVVDTSDGERNNKQKYVTDKYNVPCVYIYKPEVKWVPYQPKAPFLVLDKIYPEGVTIPEVLIGNNIIQLPTVKCVHPATEIMLGDGSVTRIGDLVEARLKQGAIPLLEADGDLRVPAAVTLFGLQAWGAEPQSTAFFWRTPANGQPLWRVHTRTGREVTVSGEHPFRTPTGWRKASELQGIASPSPGACRCRASVSLCPRPHRIWRTSPPYVWRTSPSAPATATRLNINARSSRPISTAARWRSSPRRATFRGWRSNTS